MIVFFLVDGDPDRAADRTRWGTVEDGRVHPVDDALVHPETEASFEEFVEFQKTTLRGVTDPVAVTRRFDEPPVVAAIPESDGDGYLRAADARQFGETGELAPFERFEWEQYSNLDALADDADPRAEPRRDHVVPDRFSVVSFEIIQGGSRGEVGRLDTATDEVIDSDTSRERFEQYLRGRFAGPETYDDPVELLDRFGGKTRKGVTVIDAETGEHVTDPRAILPKPNHPDHASVDLLENGPDVD